MQKGKNFPAKEIKRLTGASSKFQGINILCEELEKKYFWYCNRRYSFAGYDYKNRWVHLTSTWPLVDGGVGHSRIGISLEIAMNSTDLDSFVSELNFLN